MNNAAKAYIKAVETQRDELIGQREQALAALLIVERRLTSAANAFYVSGKQSALRDAFSGWKDDAEQARAVLAQYPSR